VNTHEEILNSIQNGDTDRHILKSILPVFLQGTVEFLDYNSTVKQAFTSAFVAGGANPVGAEERWNSISSIVAKGISSDLDLKDIEKDLRAYYQPLVDRSQREKNQKARTERCFARVRPLLVGQKIVDFGCGKGLLGEKIQQTLGLDVVIVDNIDFNQSSLNLVLADESGRTNLPDKHADTTIVYLVLHHMNDPIKGLEQIARITKQRLVIMEGYVEDPVYFYVNKSIDWFFNRVHLGVQMNIPLNFLKVAQWKFLLEQVGFRVSQVEYLGPDEELAPEHHVLFIAERIHT